MIMSINAFSLSETTSSRRHDLNFLDLALALAAKGEGHVKPNPLVGAVVVKNGIIVGQGFHRYEGVKHAEVLALEEVAIERKAQRSTLIWNPVAIEEVANALLPAAML